MAVDVVAAFEQGELEGVLGSGGLERGGIVGAGGGGSGDVGEGETVDQAVFLVAYDQAVADLLEGQVVLLVELVPQRLGMFLPHNEIHLPEIKHPIKHGKIPLLCLFHHHPLPEHTIEHTPGNKINQSHLAIELPLSVIKDHK